MDPTIVKVHPDGTGALKKGGSQSIGRSRGGPTTKIHMVAADARTPIAFALSPGQDHDAPAGRELLKRVGPPQQLQLFLVADRAYEGDETRQLALDLGYTPVIPPKSNRRHPWDYNHQIYKRRNEIERLFRRLKAYRRKSRWSRRTKTRIRPMAYTPTPPNRRRGSRCSSSRTLDLGTHLSKKNKLSREAPHPHTCRSTTSSDGRGHARR